jgi:predicted O-methyltransferase YrrM
MSKLPPSASIAEAAGGAKLHAPSAARNGPAIVALIQQIAPARGRALEIASGTGQHVAELACALPQIDWHPSEIDPLRIASVDAYVAEAGLENLHSAQQLDATRDGWSAAHRPYDLVHLSNLLHLIPEPAAKAVITEAASAVADNGLLVLYGPFKRGGALTSQGDTTFDAELRAADPAIGYKDDAWVTRVLTQAGLTLIAIREMPANNLAFIASRRRP